MDSSNTSDADRWIQTFVYDNYLRAIAIGRQQSPDLNTAFIDMQAAGDGKHNLPAPTTGRAGDLHEGTEAEIMRDNYRNMYLNLTPEERSLAMARLLYTRRYQNME